jgi:hypothetical protein
LPAARKAVDCLLKDRDALLTFFDFPAEHWTHLRTSNPIESAFATVRHRTVRMKGALSQDTARLMVFKLMMAASKSWRRLQGQNQLPKVVSGVTFRDGIEIASRRNPPLDSRRHPKSRMAPKWVIMAELRWCESPGNAARIAALSDDRAPRLPDVHIWSHAALVIF